MNKTIKYPISVGDNVDGREVLSVSNLPHPADYYLKLVLCKYGSQFVSWLYNADRASFNYGRYSDTIESAKEIHSEHCEYYNAKSELV